MKLNHQIYGVLLFIGLIILILLLNKNINTNNSKKELTEGFENQIDNYTLNDNSYFDVSVTPWSNVNLEEALQKCSNIPSCIGITRKKKSLNTPSPAEDFENVETYPVLKMGTCYTNFMGSPLQQSLAPYYKTYLKKTSVTNNCLNETNIENYFSFNDKNNLYWCVNDKKISLLSQTRINHEKMFTKAKFKIVPGLFSKGSISFQLSPMAPSTDSNTSEPVYYIVHDYPKQENLTIREIADNEADWKKKASFKMGLGLTKEGFSLKVIGFPDVYVKQEDSVLKVGMINDNEKESTTFFTMTAISETTVNQNEENTLNQASNKKTIDLSPQEKFLKMKNKNILSLEKQQMMLEEQTKKINDYQFAHVGNIGRISREFANQSAELALSKYLKEKETMDDILKKNKNKKIDNTPSVANLKN